MNSSVKVDDWNLSASHYVDDAEDAANPMHLRFESSAASGVIGVSIGDSNDSSAMYELIYDQNVSSFSVVLSSDEVASLNTQHGRSHHRNATARGRSRSVSRRGFNSSVESNRRELHQLTMHAVATTTPATPATPAAIESRVRVNRILYDRDGGDSRYEEAMSGSSYCQLYVAARHFHRSICQSGYCVANDIHAGDYDYDNDCFYVSPTLSSIDDISAFETWNRGLIECI